MKLPDIAAMQPQKMRRIVLGLIGCGLFWGGALAQAPDADRARHIREQMGVAAPHPVDAQELDLLRADISKAMEDVSRRLGALEKDMVDMKSRIRVLEVRTSVSGTPVSEATPSDNSAPRGPEGLGGDGKTGRKISVSQMQVSMCRSGCDVTDLAGAVQLVAEGGTITVAPGEYRDCVAIRKSMNLVGKTGTDGSRAHLKGKPCGGKGAIDLNAAEVTIQGLKISDIAVPDKNGACVRIGPLAKMITIKDIICLNSENGILGSTRPGGRLLVQDSRFEGNGKAARAHGMYINGGDEVILRNVQIIAANDGHLFKSGAKVTLIENSTLAALGGNTGRGVDIYGGGKFTIRNSIIQAGPNTQNHDLMAYGTEKKRTVAGGVHEILVENNWIIYDDPKRCCRWLWSKRTDVLGTITVRGNKFVGDIQPIVQGVDMRLNKEFPDRHAAGLPDYDGTLASMPKAGS